MIESKSYTRSDFIEKIRKCKDSAQVETLFMENGYEDVQNRIDFLKEAMGIESIRFFGEPTSQSIYADLLVEFDELDWRFYQ